LARAAEHRKFLLSYAEGVLSPSLKTLDGLWKFPSVEIDLICNGKEIVGIKEIQTQVHTDYGIMAILGSKGNGFGPHSDNPTSQDLAP
jgi:hypothetical protein